MIIKKRNQKLREGKKAKEQVSELVKPEIPEYSPEADNTAPAEIVEENKKTEEPEIDLFDIENIDFSQRQERRRGSRRRGYRRIDDRNLVSRAQEESENIKKSAFEEGYRAGLEKAGAALDRHRLVRIGSSVSCFWVGTAALG